MDYLDEVKRALIYIENNIGKSITVKELAYYSLCSEFHFHRIFHAATGMPIAGYIRKRRLTMAAELLTDSNDKITDISYRCGFGSQISFTRAFKNTFGITPIQYRMDGTGVSLYGKMELDGRKFYDKYHSLTIGPALISLPPITTIGLEVTGTYEEFDKDDLTHKLWNTLISRLSEDEGFCPDHLYGILFCNAVPGRFTYHAGISAIPGRSP